MIRSRPRQHQLWSTSMVPHIAFFSLARMPNIASPSDKLTCTFLREFK